MSSSPPTSSGDSNNQAPRNNNRNNNNNYNNINNNNNGNQNRGGRGGVRNFREESESDTTNTTTSTSIPVTYVNSSMNRGGRRQPHRGHGGGAGLNQHKDPNAPVAALSVPAPASSSNTSAASTSTTTSNSNEPLLVVPRSTNPVAQRSTGGTSRGQSDQEKMLHKFKSIFRSGLNSTNKAILSGPSLPSSDASSSSSSARFYQQQQQQQEQYQYHQPVEKTLNERASSVLASVSSQTPAFIVPNFPSALSPRGGATRENNRNDGGGDFGEHQGSTDESMRHIESLADHLASSPDDVVSSIYCLFDEDVTKLIIGTLDTIATADSDREVDRRKAIAIQTLIDTLGENRKALIFTAIEHYREVLIRLLEEFCGEAAEDAADKHQAMAGATAGLGGLLGTGIKIVHSTKGAANREVADAITSQERWLKHYTRRYRELTEENELNAVLKKDFKTGGAVLPPNAKVTKFADRTEFFVPPPELRELPKEKRICVQTELPAWTHAAFGTITHLNTIQTEVFESAFRTQQNMLICAPTGAGKTLVALLVILRQIQDQMRDGVLTDRDFKIVYVAPMKALAAEMTENFGKRLAPFMIKVREYTGDMQLSRKEVAETQMLVTTPEKWDVITRKQADNELAAKTKLIILDEIHLLNDDRGPVLEALVARTLRQREMDSSLVRTRLVGLSATLPNYKDVARFLRADESTGGLKAFGPDYRPIPLDQTFCALPPCNAREKESRLDHLAYDKVIANLREGHQILVFVHSRRQTSSLARFFVERAKERNQIHLFNRFMKDAPSDVKKKAGLIQGKDLAGIATQGVGVHHAGLLRFDRSAAEKLFLEGYVRVLCCTATLAWGVNTPAHTVILRGVEVYDPKKGGATPISVLDVLQIFGRAGRPGFDTRGSAIMLAENQHIQHFIRLISHALPIESQMRGQLCNHLNAEIHAGTVTSIAEGVKWLEYTYLWQRVRANPLAYGLTVMTVRKDPNLKAARYEILDEAARALHEACMVRYNPETGSLDTTDFGRIASHFYIEHVTMQTFQEKLRRPDGTMIDTLDFGEGLNLISCANEFAQLKARPDELDELFKINSKLPSFVQKMKMVQESADETSIQMKVVTLLKAYIARIPIESHSLSCDVNYIIQNAQRICRALFEIELQRGHPHACATFLTISKCIERRLFDKEHPLLQFGVEFTDAVMKNLNEKRPSLDALAEMSEREVGNLVHNVRVGGVISNLVRHFPRFEVETEIQPITRTVLRMKATLKPLFEWDDKIHGSTEVMWLFVEDSGNNFIFHHEQVLIKRKDVRQELPIVVNITVPIVPEYDSYAVRIVSDRWLGCEDEYDFSVAHLHLPDDAAPHTALLPLHPISKHAIPERYHHAFPGFSHFNAVQSQVFHVMLHTDHNVLLGAPTGSGKTICAELAMIRIFERNHLARIQHRNNNSNNSNNSNNENNNSDNNNNSSNRRDNNGSNGKPFVPEKIVYIAPLKALVKERLKDWKSRFVDQLGLSVVELSGDVTPDISALAAADVLIATPEKFDGLSRNWQTRAYIAAVALVVFDEVHMLGSDRGPILEVIVSRMRYIGWHRGKSVRLIGLSTAVSNPSDLAFWLGVTKKGALFNFHPSVRPVPMRVHIAGYPGRHYCPRMATMNRPTYNAIIEKSPTNPVIVFVSSRRQTRLTAMALINFLLLEGNTSKFVRMTVEELEKQLAMIADPHLKHCVQFGIGIHHAGLCEGDKSIMEDLYRSGRLQILVATSTLAWGLNFPARLVVIKGTEFYDAKTKSYVDMPLTDILQMIGRAGRPQFDTEGIAQVLCHEPKKSFYRKFLYDPFPVESALHKQLHAHINAEIVAGTIATRQDAVDYLTWTYLFRRLAKNPSYYGIADGSAKNLTIFLSSLVRRVLADLENSGCLEPAADGFDNDDDEDDGDAGRGEGARNPDALVFTILGKICSYYYLSHETAAFFDRVIDPSDDHATLLKKLCDAQEFNELPVRHNEDKMNIELARLVPLGIDQRNADSPHVKAFLLFQAHFHRAKLPIVDYFTDQKSAIDNSIRVLQAMVDITANNGHLFAVLRIMNLLQCMVQARWWHDSTLLQLPHILPEHLKILQDEVGISHVAQLANATLDTLNKFKRALSKNHDIALPDEHVDELVDAAKRLPLIDVRASVKKVQHQEQGESENGEAEADQDETYQVQIDLTRLSTMSKFVTAPKFAKNKDEQYWLVLGHEPTGELVALKRLNRLWRRASATLKFDWDSESWRRDDRLTLYVICDSYLGLDQQYHLKMPWQKKQN